MGDVLNDTTFRAFTAEVEFLEKLAEIRKQALLESVPRLLGKSSLIGRAGASIGKGLGSIGKGITGLPEAGRETLQLAQHPLKAIKKGWQGSKWMGEGKITKHLPIGMKSLTLGFAAPGLYDAYQASKEAPTPTGEGGVAEKLLGEVGGTGGFLAGAATKRVLPGVALMMGGQYLGGKMGRIIDRLRGGASLGTAVSAPSPTEAASQLEDVQRYYG